MASLKSLVSTLLESFIQSKKSYIAQQALPASADNAVLVSGTLPDPARVAITAPVGGIACFLADSSSSSANIEASYVCSSDKSSGEVPYRRVSIPIKKGREVRISGKVCAAYSVYFTPTDGLN